MNSDSEYDNPLGHDGLESARQRDTLHNEDNCDNDLLPESEIHATAVYHWQMQHERGSEIVEAQQHNFVAAEIAEHSPASGSSLPMAQQAWQNLLSGNNGSRPQRLPLPLALDNQWWGDECQDKLDDHIRLYVQNVNGTRLDKRGGQFDSLCQVQKEVQADVFAGQEHNLDSGQFSVRSILHTTHRQHWQRGRLNIATTPIAFKNNYKPGGTFMLTIGNTTGRIKSQDQDKWGRWVSQTLQGSADRQVTIVSVYQPVTDKFKPGTVTVATQQHTLLVQQQDQVTSPREAFCRDLRAYLLQRRDLGDELILVGDFNEEVGYESSHLLAMLRELQMDNMMSSHHSGQQFPATYSRGRRCIDYGFATPQVCRSLRQCGFEPFGYRFPSDHRAYFFDFHIGTLFGTDIQPLSKFEPRLLQSTNARQVTAYLRRLDTILQASNAYTRGDRLERRGDRHRFAERLDSDMVAGSLASERALPFAHKPAWSMELAHARLRVAILQKALSCVNHNKSFPPRLLDQVIRFCPEWELLRNPHHCRQQLQKYKLEVDHLVKQSFEKREAELQTKISSLETSPLPKDRAHARNLRQMLTCEKKCEVFRKLKAMRKGAESAGLTRIEVPLDPNADPKQCNEWRMVDIPTEVLHHLQVRNRRHFGQAHGSPFTVGPLADDLGYCGDTHKGDDILDGRYQPSSPILQPAVRMLIKHLARSVDHDPTEVRAQVTIDEFKGKLRVWRETTSTSPSKQHLGHYKALVAKHVHSHVTDEDAQSDIAMRDEMDAIQQRILRLRIQLLNYALLRGYSFTRWQTIANTHILKEPGNIKVHRTRVIHIYEADYNLAIGVKWRTALYAAEALGVMHEGQYGSRPLRMASDPVLLEQLQVDMSTVTRKTLVLTNYDATSCYDRIVPNLAMLVSRKFGVPKTVTQSNANTLEQAEYRVRTDLGLAPDGYSHTEEHPIYGTGQGSANSPAIWLFLSAALYTCYDEMATAAKYCKPDRTNECSVGMVGFVDDNGNPTNDFLDVENPETWRKVLDLTQKNAQAWTDLLSASGGALELPKCSYHLMRWQFAGNGAPILTIPDDLPDLVARDSESEEDQPLQMLTPYESHKTLGHYKEPSGSQAEQARQLKKSCQEAVDFLWKYPISRSEAWTFYTACFIPKVSYPLPLCHFREVELQDIQRKAMSIIVPRCGYNRNTKREVLFGPTSYGGAGFYDLYDQQGMGQVQTFMKHWRKHSVAGGLMKILVAWTNYSVGMGKSCLEDVHTPLPHLEAKWLTSLRTYLAKIDASFQLDDDGIPPLEREHDCYIMDQCIQSAQFKPAEIRAINYCRLYLGAVTLSDLTNTTGDRLDHAKLHGKISLMSSTTRWMTIYQESPSVAQWRIWRRANKLWSTQNGALHQPLGRWLRDHQSRRIQCCAYAYSGRLAVRYGGEYQVYKVDPFSNSHEVAIDQTRYEDMPRRARPVEVEENTRRRWKIIGTTQRLVLPRAPRHTTFRQYLNSLEPWESDLLQHVTLALDPRYTCFELHQSFLAGTDGSVKYNKEGAFGWVVATPEGDRIANGMGPSRSFKMDSYRAECSGMLSFLRFLVRLAEFAEMYDQWQGVIGTDSQSMLDRLYYQPALSADGDDRTLAVMDVMEPEWDLLIEIQDTLRELPRVRLQYVKGHQDDKVALSTSPGPT